jgi:hypothetical protein
MGQPEGREPLNSRVQRTVRPASLAPMDKRQRLSMGTQTCGRYCGPAPFAVAYGPPPHLRNAPSARVKHS